MLKIIILNDEKHTLEHMVPDLEQCAGLHAAGSLSGLERALERFPVEEEDMEKKLSFVVDHILQQGLRNEAGCKLNKVAGWKNERIRLLKLNEIMYFYAEGKKTLIHTVDGIFESKGSLTELEQRLDGNIFFRCHRSYLINLDYVEYIDPWFNQAYTVKLRGHKEEIPVSRASAKNLKRLITL